MVGVQAVLLYVVDGGVHLQLMVALLLWMLQRLLVQRSLLLKVLTLGVDLLVFYAALLRLLGGYGGHGNRDGHLAGDELVVWGGGGTQGTEALCGGAEFTVTQAPRSSSRGRYKDVLVAAAGNLRGGDGDGNPPADCSSAVCRLG